MTPGSRASLVLVPLLILAVACGSGAALTSGIDPAAVTEDEHAPYSDPSIDWENPIAGVPVSSLAEVADFLPFSVRIPKGLGQPAKILVSEPGIERHSRIIAFIYDTPSYGLVVVTEHRPELPPDEYDAANRSLLELNGRPDVYGSFEIVRIRNGADALLTSSEDGGQSTIFWLEDGIEFIVKGPSVGRGNILQLVEEI